MRLRNWVLAAAVAGMSGAAAWGQQEPQPATPGVQEVPVNGAPGLFAPAGEVQPSGVTQVPLPQPAPLPGDLQAIRDARDASAAVEAYSRATTGAAAGDRVPAEREYIRKMVDLGLPEVAEAQAQDVVNHDSHDSLAWAVVAHD